MTAACAGCSAAINGHRATLCEKCYARDYRARNADKTRAAQQAWYAKNRERVLADRKAWNRRNAEKIKARRAAQYLQKRAYAQAIVRVPVKGWGCI